MDFLPAAPFLGDVDDLVFELVLCDEDVAGFCEVSVESDCAARGVTASNAASTAARTRLGMDAELEKAGDLIDSL